MDQFRYPPYYLVKLDRVNTKTIVPLLNLLVNMVEGILIINNLDCKFYYMRSLKTCLTNILVGQTVSKVNTNTILSTYRKRREVVISNVSSNMTLITDEYKIALLASATHRKVKSGTTECVWQLYPTSDGEWIGHMKANGIWKSHKTSDQLLTGHIPPYRKRKRQSQKNKTPSGMSMDTRTQHIPPERLSHHTTPVYQLPCETTQSDNSEIFGKKCNSNLDHVYPYTPSLFAKPMFSRSSGNDNTVKLSIEATDYDPSLDGYRSNIAPSASATGRPSHGLLNTNTEIVTNFTGVRNERGTSNQYGEHAATGYDDTYYRQARSESSVPQYGTQRQSKTQQKNTKPARHPDYATLGARLESFFTYGWNEMTKPTADTLADNGLFATGNGDLVRCFQCGLGLKDWVKNDDPLTEHMTHSTDCDFLVEKLGMAQLMRIKDAATPSPSNVGNTSNSLADLTRTTPKTNLPYPVRHPRYITMEDRMASFICFPRHVTQSHRELALAGLFFTGEDDICRCFTCDGGLKNWVPGDDPIEEHATYFPQCPYLRQLKGDSFVELVQRRMQSTSETVNSSSVSSIFTPVTGRPTSQTTAASAMESFGQLALHGTRDQVAIDRLQTEAAKSVLEMGYSEDVVRRAMTQLQTRGEAMPTAQQLMELILNYEDYGGIPSVSGGVTQHKATVAQTGDLDVLSENERLKAIMKCVICHTAERNVLCIPCSHHKMCTECARNVSTCPECGRYIEKKIKTYMS